MSVLKLLASVGVLVLATSAALATPPIDRNPNKPGLGGGHGPVVSAPAPIAGVGLPMLVAAGAFVWMRNRRRFRQ